MRTIIPAAIFSIILGSLCPPLAAQSTPPTFLFLLEGKGVPTGTIHVFGVNSSTGALTEVTGSPFNAGLTPLAFALDPTRRFLYVANEQSQDITGFSVDASTGALTELPGSPIPIGNPPEAIGIDPTGRFLYVSATTTQGQSIYEFTIDAAAGVLNAAPGSPQGLFATAFNFAPIGGLAYLSQGSPDLGQSNPILICSIDFATGLLTPIGEGQPAAGGATVATVSPNGGLLFSIDPVTSSLDAFAVSSDGTALTEVSGSPYVVPFNPYSLVVDPSGNFLYVVNENEPYQITETPSQYDGEVSVFSVDQGTGGLTQVAGSPVPAGINPLSIVADPSGRFAYTTSTMYTTGFTGFAQIMGFSIDASSGFLTPLSSTPWTDSANSNGAQLVISHGSSTTPNPVPMISSLSPPSTTATATAFTLQVNGANFVPGATVYFGGQPRVTTFVNSTQLNVSILGSDVNNSGTAVIFVFNPLPGGGASTSVGFPISALTPVISFLGSSSVPAGTIGFTLGVDGSNFEASSIVNFNGTAMPTQYSSPTAIAAAIPVTDILVPGTATITVTNPANGVPGGGISNAVTLTIGPATSSFAVTSISPTSASAGGPAFTLTVNGSGFVQASQVTFNLINVTTAFVSSSQLTASIPASAIAIAGNPYVIVQNPDGFASVQIPFAVDNPKPGGGSVDAGSNAPTLNVSGTGFVLGSLVLVNGDPRVTTFESSTLLEVTLLPGDLSQGGTLSITIVNLPPGGGTSTAIMFTAADYSLTPPASTPPITAGQTATFSLTVSPLRAAFSYPVTFSITAGLPIAGATSSFTPSIPVTPGALPQTVTLSIATTPHTATSMINFPRGPRQVRPFVCLLAGMVLAMAGFYLWAPGDRPRRLAPQLLLMLLIVAAAGLVACGAVGTGSSSPASPSPAPPPPVQLNPATGTPAGTYRLVVSATSGGVSHSTTVTLTVM